MCLLFCCQSIIAQNSDRRVKLNNLSIELRQQEDEGRANALKVARLNGWETNNLIYINQFGNPEYRTHDNNQAATTVGTVALRTNQSVTGAGMTLGLWEAGSTANPNGAVPLLTHQDFQSRITIKDGTSSGLNSFHASHVAGTMIGAPPGSAGNASRGMAIAANLDAYNAANDGSEMATAAASSIAEVDAGKLLISNHSYGQGGGWSPIANTNNFTWTGGSANFTSGGTDPSWGVYTTGSDLAWDIVAFNAPYYLICKSAGNENNDNPTNGSSQVRNGSGGSFVTYNTTIHPLGDGIYANGFRTIKAGDLGKNIMTVGAIDNSGNITNFSSTGPTGDGRIKPDITGVGLNLNSASNASNSAYGVTSGTSMATPNTSGSLILLQELYSDKYTVGSDHLYMRAPTLKALAIHSATDLGNPGPDYTYGWGRIDMDEAGDFIEEDAKSSGATVLIIEDVLPTASEVYEIEVDAIGGNTSTTQLQATMVYNDVPADTLVNDLDLRIVRNSNGAGHIPWLLDPSNPGNNASGGDDDVNNVERIQIASLAETYTVRITVEGTLFQNEPQPFSLIISGLDPGCQSTIQHRMLDLPTGTYTAKSLIRSEAKLVTAGREITYESNGRIELKPGFHAKAQTSTGAGFFKTSAGTCN